MRPPGRPKGEFRSAKHEGTPETAEALRVAVGLGCDRGTPLETVERALVEALQQVGLSWSAVRVLASIEAKAQEPAFLELAARRGWPLRWFSAAELAAVPVPNPSDTVLRYMGTPSVSEAAALLAAGDGAGPLLLEKLKRCGADGKNATVSLALIPVVVPSSFLNPSKESS